MKQMSYLLFFVIRIIILYMFYLMYQFVINGSLFGQICYVLLFVIYYFCRDINLEYNLGLVKKQKQSVKMSIISGVVNLLVNTVLLILILQGLLDVVFLIFVVEYVYKIMFDRSLFEVLLCDRIFVGDDYEDKI